MSHQVINQGNDQRLFGLFMFECILTENIKDILLTILLSSKPPLQCTHSDLIALKERRKGKHQKPIYKIKTSPFPSSKECGEVQSHLNSLLHAIN